MMDQKSIQGKSSPCGAFCILTFLLFGASLRKMKEKIRIISACNIHKDGVEPKTGDRYFVGESQIACKSDALARGVHPEQLDNFRKGYMTSEGHFYCKKEAFIIAKRAKQIDPEYFKETELMDEMIIFKHDDVNQAHIIAASLNRKLQKLISPAKKTNAKTPLREFPTVNL